MTWTGSFVVWAAVCCTLGTGECSGQDARPGAPDPASPAPASAPAGELPAGAIRVEKAAIVDAYGFEQPLVAATLFLPHGWQTQGGVEWGQQYMCTNGYAFRWSATSPDGKTTIALLPQEHWEWNNYGAPASTPGCPLVQVFNVRQYLEGLVQRYRPAARLLDYAVRDDLQQKFAHLASVTPMPLGETRTWVEAGQVTYAWSEQGQELRGSVAAVAVFTLMRSNAGSGNMDALSAGTFPAYSASAPREQFDASFFEALRRSIKVDPGWERRISGHNTAIAQVALRESKKRSEITARYNAEIAAIREDAWSAYQESSDRRFREFGEALRGVETYDDPNAATGQVELSSSYEHAWALDDGTYVLTNDVGFEPYRDLGLEGNRLEATR